MISLDFNLSLRTFLRCVFLENLTFTTFLSPFINTVLSFSSDAKYYLWLDSKYNVRRCDV